MRRFAIAGFVSALVGCADESAGHVQAHAGAAGEGHAHAGAAGSMHMEPTPEASVEIGIPAGESGLDFAPLEDGAEVRLQTFGQGGTHIIIGVRCRGFGSRAFVSAVLRNPEGGIEVLEPPPARPQLLYCGEENVCDLVPYLVHASGIARGDEERHGLEVELSVTVENEASVKAEGMRRIVLSTADL